MKPTVSKLSGPQNEYRTLLQTGELRPDPVQALAVEKLQSLHHALAAYEPAGGGKSWKERFGLGRRRENPPQGLYIFGGVGRGKSMLMDLFFRTAPTENKRRVHFHAFMQQIHARLNEYRKWKGRGDDPIPPIAKRLAGEATLLCFDEFQVHDIADAMILGRLFETLFEAGVVVVATSNRPPSELYKDGLQRALFEPFIDLIEEKLDLLMLDGGLDYRSETIQQAGTYLVPDDDHAARTLSRLFERLTSEAEELSDPIMVNGRRLDFPMAADGVALIGFKELCGAALGPADYLAVAERYHTLIMPGIPQMGPDSRNEAKRFVTLIDVLYENGVNLVCSAAAPPSRLYIRGDGAFEFERTASRLLEMQSEEYLGKPHVRPLCKAGAGTKSWGETSSSGDTP